MSILTDRHKNLSSSPEITTRSPPLFNFTNWFSNRLPKPSKSQQPAHLTQPAHYLSLHNPGIELSSPSSSNGEASRPDMTRTTSHRLESQSDYVYVNGQGEARRVSYAQLPAQYRVQRRSSGMGWGA